LNEETSKSIGFFGSRPNEMICDGLLQAQIVSLHFKQFLCKLWCDISFLHATRAKSLRVNPRGKEVVRLLIRVDVGLGRNFGESGNDRIPSAVDNTRA